MSSVVAVSFSASGSSLVSVMVYLPPSFGPNLVRLRVIVLPSVMLTFPGKFLYRELHLNCVCVKLLNMCHTYLRF